ncbi:MAG: D-alanyl-D-alanine carboxypeptidase family protein [Spirulinaceae cyanobacterium]
MAKKGESNLEKSNLSNFYDIPEAQRTNTPISASYGLKPILFLVGGLGLGAIAVLASVLFINQVSQQTSTATEIDAVAPSPTTADSPASPNPSDPTVILPRKPNSVIPSPDNSSPASPNPTAPSPTAVPEPAIENVLGHLPYEEATAADLTPITADGRIRLRPAAAEKFQAMVRDARASGVNLVPLSGYRTVQEQEYLFFEIKAQRNQDASKRAEVSAPPGYSEHHTGYAIDIGDARVPATNLSVNFEETAAFQWLEQNAARYGFELSFPRDNPQGISYEPWHWRFVGNIDSLETFYRAQNLPKQD